MRIFSLAAPIAGLAIAVGLTASLATTTPARADGGVIAAIIGGVVVASAISEHHHSNIYRRFPPRTVYRQCRPGYPSCERVRLCGYNAKGEYYCHFQ